MGGLLYSTQTGNTETVASIIAEAAGVEAVAIDDVDAADLAGYDGLIVGTPTWNTGADEFRSGTTWDDYLEEIKALDLKGKPVAVSRRGTATTSATRSRRCTPRSRRRGRRCSGQLTPRGTRIRNRKASRTASFWVCRWTKTTRTTRLRAEWAIGSRS